MPEVHVLQIGVPKDIYPDGTSDGSMPQCGVKVKVW